MCGYKRIMLRNKSHISLARRELDNIGAVDVHFASIQLLQTGYAAQRGRFSRTGWAQHGDKLLILARQKKYRLTRLVISKTLLETDDIDFSHSNLPKSPARSFDRKAGYQRARKKSKESDLLRRHRPVRFGQSATARHVRHDGYFLSLGLPGRYIYTQFHLLPVRWKCTRLPDGFPKSALRHLAAQR